MITILGIDVLADINKMKTKVIDEELIEQEEHLTFFKIMDEQSDKISKVIRESMVTEDYNNETILNLEEAGEQEVRDIERDKILNAFELYNNALSFARSNYISGATKLIDSAYEMYKRDMDILNLRGMLKLLDCEFSESYKSFALSQSYISEDEKYTFEEQHKLSKKYIDLFNSEKFEILLGRFNHAMRFISEGLDYEAVSIFENILAENPDLTKPHVTLAYMYKKLGKSEKLIAMLENLRNLDKDNLVIQKPEFSEKLDGEESNIKARGPLKKTNIYPSWKAGLASIVAILAIGATYYINIKPKLPARHISQYTNLQKINSDSVKNSLIENGNDNLENNGEINRADKAKKDSNSNVYSDSEDGSTAEINKEEKTEGIQKKELTTAKEAELYEEALRLKAAQDNECAIRNFKEIVENGNVKKYKAESTYQVAMLSAKIDRYDDAVKYYEKYIDTYNKSDEYYDDSYYELGMLYYKKGNLKKAQDTLVSMISEVSDSIYNDKRVKEILREK
ncbi:MAG: tetratricopeptide repeat protein [Clostridioides sp.]|nr:tetratricopeptide repeat protein [Clostridioides sp.]